MSNYAYKSKGDKRKSIVNNLSNKQNNQEFALQFKDNRKESVAQLKQQESINKNTESGQITQLQTKADSHVVKQKHPIQRRKNTTGLPDGIKSGIENLSGYSMDDVKVHYNSTKPAQLKAHAYAQGTDIHIASGQEKHLGHEAWHVVQQKQGRVKATTQMKGIGVNDDTSLEREADVMGEKAMRGGIINKTSQLKKQTGNSTVQGRFLKLGYMNDEEDLVSNVESLKKRKAKNGLATLTDNDWRNVGIVIGLSSIEKIFAMNEQGQFDAEEVKQECYEIAKAKEFANYIDQGHLVAFGDKHQAGNDFDFPKLIGKVASRRSTVLLEAPEISLEEMDAWGQTSADTRNIATFGATMADRGWSVQGVDALHKSGSGYTVGDSQYLDLEEQQLQYGQDRPYPEKALGPGGRIGPIRQMHIANKLKVAMRQGGCLLVIGSTHISGKSGSDYVKINGAIKARRVSYNTPSLHQLITQRRGQIERVKMNGKSYKIQVIRKDMIR